MIALTFDEGPGDSSLAIRESLLAAKAWSTFHVVTRYLGSVQYLTNLQELKRDGHVIGLRFPTTINPMLLSDDLFVKTLLDESRTLKNYIGVYPKYLRLPDGGYDDRLVNLARGLGFQVTRWNVDLFDYDIGNSTAVDKIPLFRKPFQAEFSQVSTGSGRYIALFHDQAPVYQNRTLLVNLADWLRNSSYKLVTMDACLMDTDPYRATNDDTRAKKSDKPSSSLSAFGTVSWSAIGALSAVAIMFSLL